MPVMRAAAHGIACIGLRCQQGLGDVYANGAMAMPPGPAMHGSDQQWRPHSMPLAPAAALVMLRIGGMVALSSQAVCKQASAVAAVLIVPLAAMFLQWTPPQALREPCMTLSYMPCSWQAVMQW